jgi:hypothetical protein
MDIVRIQEMQYALQTEQSRLEAEGWTCKVFHVTGSISHMPEIIATREVDE